MFTLPLFAFIFVVGCTSTHVRDTSRVATDALTWNVEDINQKWVPLMAVKGRVVPAVPCYIQMSDLRVEIQGPAPQSTIVGTTSVDSGGSFEFSTEANWGSYVALLVQQRGHRVLDSQPMSSTIDHDRFNLSFKICADTNNGFITPATNTSPETR
jgi:hypothetical protein